jgi:hypothetical protein
MKAFGEKEREKEGKVVDYYIGGQSMHARSIVGARNIIGISLLCPFRRLT